MKNRKTASSMVEKSLKPSNFVLDKSFETVDINSAIITVV